MANDCDGHHTLKKKLSDHGKALFRQSQGVDGPGQMSPATSFTAPPPKRQSHPPPRMSRAGNAPAGRAPARSTMPPIREERAGGPRPPPPLPGGGKPPPLPAPAKNTAPAAAGGGRGMLLNAITGFDASALKKTKTVDKSKPAIGKSAAPASTGNPMLDAIKARAGKPKRSTKARKQRPKPQHKETQLEHRRRVTRQESYDDMAWDPDDD